MANKDKSWKGREHLFTSSNITKLEFICKCEKRCSRKLTIRLRSKKSKHGKVVWLVKDGKPV
jgi:hypothetical protein